MSSGFASERLRFLLRSGKFASGFRARGDADSFVGGKVMFPLKNQFFPKPGGFLREKRAAKNLASGYETTEEQVHVVTAAAKTWNRIHDSPPGEECSCSVLYFTSGDIFNKNVRIHTVEKGFTINTPASHPLGVTGDAGKALPVEREDNIFGYVH